MDDTAVVAYDLLRQIRRRLWLVVVGGLAGGIAGAVVASMQPKSYDAVTTLLVRRPGGAGAAGAAAMRPVIDNQAVGTKVVQELGLSSAPHNLSASSFRLRHLDVENVSGSGLVRVHVRFPDPALAARAANAVATEAVALNDVINQGSRSGTDGLMERELTSARRRLEEARERWTRERERPGGRGAGNDTGADERRLQSEYDLAGRLYEEIAVQWGKLRLQQVAENSELLVLDKAVPPEEAEPAFLAANAGFGALSGAAFSLVAVTLLAYVSLGRTRS